MAKYVEQVLKEFQLFLFYFLRILYIISCPIYTSGFPKSHFVELFSILQNSYLLFQHNFGSKGMA